MTTATTTLYAIHVYPHGYSFFPETRRHVAGTLDQVKEQAIALAAERSAFHHGHKPGGAYQLPIRIAEERGRFDNPIVVEHDGAKWIAPVDHSGVTWDFTPGQ